MYQKCNDFYCFMQLPFKYQNYLIICYYIFYMEADQEKILAEKRRKDMKNFLAMKRNQAKNLKNAAKQGQDAWKAITDDSPKAFLEILSTMTNQSSYNFLFSEDQFKRTPLMLIFSQNSWMEFLAVINQWSRQKKEYIEKQISQSFLSQFKSLGLERNFNKFNQELVRAIVQSQQKTENEKIVGLLTQESTLFYQLFLRYYELTNILKFLSKEHQCEIFSHIYLPILQKLKMSAQTIKATKYYLIMIKKQDIWQRRNFLPHVSEPQLLSLKVLNYNFLHELATNKETDLVLSTIDDICMIQAEDPKLELKSIYFSMFNLSGETPIDIIFRSWKYENIQQFLKKIQGMEEISLSIGCLNYIITNPNLSQQQVQKLIKDSLQGLKSDHGYCEQIHTQTKKSKNGKVFTFKNYDQDSISTTDKIKVLKAKGKFGIYPLLSYLQRFTQTANLSTVNSLFLKLLQRKNIKKFYYSAIHQYGSKTTLFQNMNEGFKQSQEIQYYLNPLMQIMCRIQNLELLEYLLEKILINYMFITTNGMNLRLVNRHFITYYIENHKDLSENNCNKKILEKIISLKDFQKLSSEKYDHITLLLINLNRSKAFQQSKQWLPEQIKQFLREYIRKCQSENHEPYEEIINNRAKEIFNYRSIINLSILFNGEEVVKYQLYDPQRQKIKQINDENQQKYLFINLRGMRKKKNLLECLQARSKQRQEKTLKPLFLTIDDPRIVQKMKIICKYSQNFYISVIRGYPQGTDQKYQAFIESLQAPWKNIVSVMLKNRKKLQSMRFFTALLCCQKQDVTIFLKFVMQNAQKQLFKKSLKQGQKSNLPINYFLLHQLKKTSQFSDLHEYDHTFQKYIQSLKQKVKPEKKKQIEKEIIQLMICLLPKEEQYQIIRSVFNAYPNLDLAPVLEKIEAKKIVDKALKRENQMWMTFRILTAQNPIQTYKQIKGQYDSVVKPEKQRQRKQKQQKGSIDQDDYPFSYLPNQFIIYDMFSGRKYFQKNVEKMFQKHVIDLSMSDFQEFVNEVTNLEDKSKWLYLMLCDLSEQKKIYCLKKYLKISAGFLTVREAKRIVGKAQYKILNSTIFSYLQKNFTNILFEIQQNDTQITVDGSKYLSSCNEVQYQNIMTHFKTITHDTKDQKSMQLMENRLTQSFIDLYTKNKWDRIIILAQNCNLNVYQEWIKVAFDYFAKNYASAQNYQNKESYDKLIKYMFDNLETKIENREKMDGLFINAYVLNPEKALQIFGVQNRSLLDWAKCLQHRPETAALLYTKQIQISKFPDSYKGQVPLLLPMSPYSVHEIPQKAYLIDLIKIQEFFSKQWKQNCYQKIKDLGQECSSEKKEEILAEYQIYYREFSNKKSAIFMLKQAQERHQQIYDHQELLNFSHQIFTNNILKSIHDVPKEYLAAYIEKHGNMVKYFQGLQKSVVKQLIDQGYIKDKTEFWEIIKTCDLEIIAYYLEKLNLTVNQELIASVETDKNKKTLIERLFEFDNDKFVAEFLEKFSILDKFNRLQQSNIMHSLLTTLCVSKSPILLKILIQKLQKSHPGLNYMPASEQEQSGIRENTLYLPKFETEKNYYYQYYFLLKKSGNHQKISFNPPNFDERFIFSSADHQYPEYQFLPDMKKRLQFLNAISHVLPNGHNKKIFCQKLLPSILLDRKIKHYQLFRGAMNGILDCDQLIYYNYQNFEDRVKEREGNEIYVKLYILLKHPELKVQLSEIQRDFSNKVAVLRKVQQLSDPQVINIENFDKLICNMNQLSKTIIRANPSFFFKNINHQKFLKQNMEHLEDFVHSLSFFEKQENLSLCKQFIDKAFFVKENDKPQPSLQADFRMKYLLMTCLINKFEGNGQIVKYVAQCLNENTDQILQKLAGSYRHRKDQENLCLYWDNVANKLIQISNGKFTSKGNYKFYNQSSLNNAQQILSQASDNLPDIFAFVSVLRNQLYLQHQLNIIKNQIKNNKQGYKLEINLAKQFNYQDNGSIGKYTFPYQLIKQTYKIFIMLDNNQIMNQVNRIEYLKVLRQMGAFQIFNCLGDLRFRFDYQSFKPVKNCEYLEKITHNYVNTFHRTPLSILHEYGDNLNRNVNDYYKGFSLSDVFGPFPINDDTDKSKVIECICFYEYLKLPNTQITLKYSNNPKIQSGSKKMLSDIKQYIRYFTNEINDDQDTNKIPYNFNKTIYFNKEQKQTIMYDEFYLHNIIEFFTKLYMISQQYTVTFNNLINVRFSALSILQIIENKIDKLYTALDVLKEISNFLMSQQNIRLMEAILFMIIDDATNIMKVFKGILVSYKKVEKYQLQAGQMPFKIYDGMMVYGIKYMIQSSIFVITILYKEQNDTDIKQAQTAEESKLISRKQFLSMIFSSTQFLTDYFLEKNLIATEMMSISQQLSKKYNMTINCSANYATLYLYIDKLKQRVQVKQIDGTLVNLRRYIIGYFQKYINNYLNSKEIKDQHSIMMNNKFEAIYHDVKVEDIYNRKSLDFGVNKQANNALTEIKSLADLKKNNDDVNIQNMYLIQIYKSYFATVVREGMAFIVGYKNPARTPIAIRLKKKEDVDAVNISEVGFLLMITNRLPTNDEISHNKIIRIFVCDLSTNIYQLNQKLKTKLLSMPQDSDDRNISDFMPPIQPNIILTFKSQLGGQPNLKDDNQHKYFFINLQTKNQFKIEPDYGKPISIINYLKINNQFNQLVNTFIGLISNNCQLNVRTIVSDQCQRSIYVESFRYLLYDLENVMNSMFYEPLRLTALETYVSLKGQDVHQNYIAQRKKKLFHQIFETIEIQATTQGYSKILIQDKIIRIILKIDKKQQKILTRAQIYKTIMQHFIKQISIMNNCANYNYEIDQSNLMNIIDNLSIANLQIEVIQNTLKIAQKIVPENIRQNLPEKYQITLNSKVKAHSIVSEKKNIQFLISSATSDPTFFTELEILSYLYNGNKQTVEAVALTRYLPTENIIEIVNYHQICNATLILISDDGQSNIQDIVFKHDQNNITRAYLYFPEGQKYHRYYIIQQFGGYLQFCHNYFIKSSQIDAYLNNKGNTCLINQQKSLIVFGQSLVNLNKCPISYYIDYKNTDIKAQKVPLTFKSQGISIRLFLLDSRTLLIRYKSSVSCSLKFYLQSYTMFGESLKSHSINIVSGSKMVVQNTKFQQVRFRKKVRQVKNFYEKDQNSQRIKTFKQPPEQSIVQLKEMDHKATDVQSLVYIVNQNAKRFLTRAGQQRVDVITLCDGDGNPVIVNLDNVSIYFKHSNLNQIIKPVITMEQVNLLLDWTPTVRGPYQIYLNNIRLNPEYELGVCAACADLSFSKIEIPKKTKICFGEQSECMLQLKDSYGNIYTELQENIIGDKLIVEAEINDATKVVKIRNETINKYGFKKLKFWIDDPTGSQQQTLTIKILLNKQVMTTFDIFLKGQALQQRMKKLEKEFSNTSKGYYKEIIVSRRNFLEDLFKIAQKSMLVNFGVKFVGEQGIDAGGLKREFYDMIGTQLKKTTNPFFKCVDTTKNAYFLSASILKNKKQAQYMALIGKYLANSFINGYLIGVNFSSVFVKMLFGDEITYEDMFEVIPKQEADRYRYLLTANAEQFEDLQLYFSVVVDRKKGKQFQLIEDGAEIAVTKENAQQYLSLLTKVLITDRFKDAIENLRKGFEQVMPLGMVTKWIRPDQFWALTIGIKEINADIVINYINFKGGQQMHQNWMRRYLKESNTEILEGFLKFASGSSSIDFYQTYKVVVTFTKSGGNPKKLPISHTCWKEIIIPCYKSYDIMKQLLNAAFLYCSQGFGLA